MIDILEFSGENEWLSNHYVGEDPIYYDNIAFPTVEHAYVYAKTIIPEEQEILLAASKVLSAKQMKILGKDITLREDWEEIKVPLMLGFTRQKYLNLTLRQKLLNTEDCLIVEGNWWHDYFWGMCNGKGKNVLGQLIMQVRQEISSDGREEYATISKIE